VKGTNWNVEGEMWKWKWTKWKMERSQI